MYLRQTTFGYPAVFKLRKKRFGHISKVYINLRLTEY